MSLLPRGTWYCSICWGGLYFWNVDTGELQEVISGIGGYGLTTSPDGLIVGANVNESYHFWDMQNGIKVMI